MSPGPILPEYISDMSDLSGTVDMDEDQDLLEPVAVIGFSLKFPQDATSPGAFWKLMAEKRSAMTDFPADRLNIEAFYHPKKRNALPVRGGHFIKDNLGAFDADFFSITPYEAAAMDPAQRILLETTFRAIENAGIRLEELRGSNTSVHTGCFTTDYLLQLLKDAEQLPTYAAVGATLSMLANRISWFFNLTGPSVNLDSACSSSAMAIDQACQLLRSGECSMGIVAGCNLTFDPDYTKVLTNMQFLSPDSRCFAFDHRANGYSRGEGVGVVVLKLISDALRDNDTVRAVIRSSGSNQDGRTPGITQPNNKAQARLIRDTYRKAGLTMRHTRFFEAHGTGTAIGDPAEADAIADSFQTYRSSNDPLYVGAVKTNIGHLEGASGIAGLIKTILVVETGVIVPNTNFEQINRRLGCEESCIALPTACVAWPKSDVRRASINSFGYGGSNSHIIIDDVHSYLNQRGLRGNHRTVIEIPGGALEKSFGRTSHVQLGKPKSKHPDSLFRTPKLLIWSASDETSLKQQVVQCQEHCSETLSTISEDGSFIHDLAYTLDSRRSSLSWKSFAIINSTADMKDVVSIVSKPIAGKRQGPRLAFVFTGQGAQWYAMGRELLGYATFTGVIEEAGTFLASLGCPWSVKEELLKSEHKSNVDKPDFAQPLCAILQIGLVDLMKDFGVTPIAVVGHSMGEIAAAYCAGALSRESAFKLAYYRGMLVATIPERDTMKGAMMAIGLSPEDIIPYFDRVRPEYTGFNIMVSCINSPVNITVSGDESQIEALKQILHDDAVFARRLRVNAAYHSPQMKQIAADCLSLFGTLQVQDPLSTVEMISTVTGSRISKKELCQAGYWVRNMISPVLFLQAIQYLCLQSKKSLTKKLDGSHRRAVVVDHIIEIGPHAALQLPLQNIISTLPRGHEISYLSAIYRKRSATTTLLELLGHLHCIGVQVCLRRVNEPDPYASASRICLVNLPEYPFNHMSNYWYESSLSRNYRLRPHGHVELLGIRSREWNPLNPQWRCCVRTSDMPWLEDHKMNGKILYPASAMISMAIEAALQLADRERRVTGFTLCQVQFQFALAVSVDSTDVETRFCLKPLKSGPNLHQARWEFTMFSMIGESWAENCRGIIQVHYAKQAEDEESIEMLSRYQGTWASSTETCVHTVDPVGLYRTWRKQGFQYGSSFQGISAAQHNGIGKATASVALCKPLEISSTTPDLVIHPASLDTIMQLALVALTKGGTQEVSTQVITAINKIWISNEGLRASNQYIYVSANIDTQCPRTTVSSLFVLNEDHQRVRLILDGLETSTVATSRMATETSLGATQYWYNIHSHVDVEMLTPAETIQWLNLVCGPDATGPISFCLDLHGYILSAMRSLQYNIKSTGLKPGKSHLQKYVHWIDWQLEIQADVEPFDLPDESLVSRIDDQGSVGRTFTQVAEHVLGVLKGDVDVLQLLFESNLVKEFYEEQSFGSKYFLKIKKYVEGLAFRHPRMNILEVGAGTGTFTKHVLNALLSNNGRGAERYNHYFYTDVSPAFFERARDEFSTHAHKMIFRTFDIERDPSTQGYEEASFDIIAASNVLHVTKSLSKTLQAIRRLLKPGGKLILHENTSPDEIETGFIFGLLPGWWLGTEDDRTMSPTVADATWDKMLALNGFSGADFTLRDYAADSCHLMSIICATAVESQDEKKLGTDLAIVIEQGSSLQADLAYQLEARLTEEKYVSVRIVFLTQLSPIGTPTGLLVNLLDIETPILSRLTEQDYSALKSIMLSAGQVLWVTNGGNSGADPGFGMIDGVAKVLRIEHVKLRIATLALENLRRPDETHVRKIVQALGQFLGCSGDENLEDYVSIDGALSINRISENNDMKSTMMEILSRRKKVVQSVEDSPPFAVKIQSPGQLETLEIIEDVTALSLLQQDEVEVEVHAVGLNAIDSMIAVGRTSTTSLGRECSGIIRAVGTGSTLCPGDRVCTYGSNVFKSVVRTKKNLVARIPEGISFAEASILPQEYLFASYLVHSAIRLTSKDTVLIHGGHTSIAKAVINLSLDICTSVFVTTPTKEDEEALRSTYTKEQVQLLSYVSFSEQLRRTAKRGVDVVLNLSSESDFLGLLECAAAFGQVMHVEPVVKSSTEGRTVLKLPSNISFKAVDMVAILRDRLDLIELPLQSLLDTAMQFNDLNCRHLHTFNLSQIEKAFASLREIGSRDRVAIAIGKKDRISIIQELKPTYVFSPFSSYLVSGGLGDLGRCLVRWMVSRGAQNLILLSRSGPRTEVARQMIRELEEKNIHVYVPSCDVSNRSALEGTLRECSRAMPPIKGCIQASAALKDVMYTDMSWEDWKIAIKPKVEGSWNLHNLLPKGMDFFIMTSSITGILGQATQINYAAANTYQDALARYRIASGEKAVSLDLGLLLTGGLLSQNPTLLERFTSTGYFIPISEPEVLALFEYFCNPALGIPHPSQAQVIVGIKNPADISAQGLDLLDALRQPLWSQTHPTAGGLLKSMQPVEEVISVTSLLRKAESISEAGTIVTRALVQRFSRMLAIPEDNINIEEPLHANGVDSLSAVDLRNWVMKTFGVDVPVFDILGDTSIAVTGRLIAKKWQEALSQS